MKPIKPLSFRVVAVQIGIEVLFIITWFWMFYAGTKDIIKFFY